MIIRSRGPLRVSFAGGGTELSPYIDQKGGLILNTTINLYAYTTLKLRKDGKVIFECLDDGSREEFYYSETKDYIPQSKNLRMHDVVFKYFYNLYPNEFKLGLELITHSEAPVGSGLGTSSTLSVTIIYAFTNFLNLFYSKKEIAKLGYYLERELLGLKGGLQDHFSASHGGLNFIEFRSYEDIIVNKLRLDKATKCELEASLLLYYTGKSRNSGDIITEQVNEMTKGNIDFQYYDKIKKLAHLAKDNVMETDLKKLGQILHESWQQKRKLSSRISNDLIDELYDDLLKIGIYGGKISGAGGGGFFLIMMNPLLQPKVINYLNSRNDERGFIF